MDQLMDQNVNTQVPLPWLWRRAMTLEAWARPLWGWGVLVAAMLLTVLPAVSLRSNQWLALGNFQFTLEIAGPMAVATVWGLLGWRKRRRDNFGWLVFVWSAGIGFVVLSQLILGWIPGPRILWGAVSSGEPMQLLAHGVAAWMRAFTRFALWREGVAAGGAAQDNLVFATIGCTVLWMVGTLTAWLARRVRQGFAAAAPSLWLLGLILLYSSSGRYLLLTGLALTLLLHIVLEQGSLIERWQQLQLDYSPGLLMDRMVSVISAGAVILTLAAVMPNLYVQPLVTRYYTLLAPVHLAMEELSERLFPELRGTSRLRGGAGTGMPNEFLLQGGPNAGSAVVMRVRTNEAAAYAFPFDEMAPPPGYYMRGRTLTVYEGLGWSNPFEMQYEEVPANRRWEGANEWGRKEVVQSIILEGSASSLFAAPEPIEVSTDARIESRAGGDIVAVQARDSSYTVVSMVPAVSEEMLRALPSWVLDGDESTASNPVLPEALRIHLALPGTVTERTRELAKDLIAGQPTDYDKALAIEQYLRQYVYDLEVSKPPDDVTDVADYFLFELQRGYCDYYATAFVVLARLAGMPTRFATGFAAGEWNPIDGVYTISEGDAHSWPEVYFPEAGWVPFEPTAGRSSLVRASLPQAALSVLPLPLVAAAPVVRETSSWNWQQVVWLIPIGGILWLLVLLIGWWRGRQEDPWQAVLQWGSRAGRPMGDGETVLEYGEGLAGFVLHRQLKTQDAGRIAAREIQAVSEEVNRVHYGRVDERLGAQKALEARWTRLRNYLPLVRFR